LDLEHPREAYVEVMAEQQLCGNLFQKSASWKTVMISFSDPGEHGLFP
jgi:hypothetical protein